MPNDNGSLTGSKAAMIVVDMQNAFLNDEGSMNRGSMDSTELKNTVLPVSNLIVACRSTDVPIIFTRYVLRSDYKDAGLRSIRRSKFKEINSLVVDTWDSELDPRMDQRLEDYVLDKTHYLSLIHI